MGEELDLAGTEVFHFDEEFINFNDLCSTNGFTYWFARDYMDMLGYGSYQTFKKAINRASQTCLTLDINVNDNFKQVKREINGTVVDDLQLSRFACYLVAMNGDNKKTRVAQAQAFFAATAETIRRYVDDAEQVERVQIRDEISIHEKGLGASAKVAGVREYALFQNAGYRGLYNMNLNTLKKYKGQDAKKLKRSLLDFMGKQELAANLFRITQTEAKIQNENIRGQANAENAAWTVGKMVRKTMLEISGDKPEDLPLQEDIKKIQTSLKQTQRGLAKIDGE